MAFSLLSTISIHYATVFFRCCCCCFYCGSFYLSSVLRVSDSGSLLFPIFVAISFFFLNFHSFIAHPVFQKLFCVISFFLRLILSFIIWKCIHVVLLVCVDDHQSTLCFILQCATKFLFICVSLTKPFLM